MEHHEMAEKLVEKCGISYEEAGEVLREAGFDMLEAMIILERRGKPRGGNNKYSTGTRVERYSYNSQRTAADAESFKEFAGMVWNKVCEFFRDILKYQVVIHRGGAELLTFPLLLAVLLLCCTAGAAFVVIIITLFRGCSYTIRKNV